MDGKSYGLWLTGTSTCHTVDGSFEIRRGNQLRDRSCISHYLQGFIHPKGGWLAGISEASTVIPDLHVMGI